MRWLGMRSFGGDLDQEQWSKIFQIMARRIKGTDESTLVKDLSLPLVQPDPNDLGSLILIQITPSQG